MNKALHVLILVCTLLFFSTGCTSINRNEFNTTQKDQEQYNDKPEVVNKDIKREQLLIASIVMQDDQYMRLLQLGMKDTAEKAGAKVLLANSYNNLDKEIQLVNTYVSSGVDGICIHPISADVSVLVLKKAVEKGVAVVSAGVGLDDDYNIPSVESDQVELGRKTGEACRKFIEERLGGKASIAILRYNSLLPEQSVERTKGFKSEVTKLPGVKIVTEQDAWLAEAAVSKAGDIIDSYPGLDIIWSANEGGTIGAVIAVKNSGKAGKIYVFGTDAYEQLAKMILDPINILQATTGQRPYETGVCAMEKLIRKINGERVEKRTKVSEFPLSRTNPDVVKKYLEDLRKIINAN